MNHGCGTEGTPQILSSSNLRSSGGWVLLLPCDENYSHHPWNCGLSTLLLRGHLLTGRANYFSSKVLQVATLIYDWGRIKGLLDFHKNLNVLGSEMSVF